MRKNFLYIICACLLIAIIGIVIWGVKNPKEETSKKFDDGVEQLDLNTIKLKDSKVEVQFSDVLLSDHKEERKLIVSTQKAKVSIKLTDRVCKYLDIKALEKSQTVSYKGTGIFAVDLKDLKADDIIQDSKNKTLTIAVKRPALEAIEINPDEIKIDEVDTGLLAWGKIKLTYSDYVEIEKELREKLKQEFDTAENGQKANEIALRMVKEIYEPIVKAIDEQYTVEVIFK